MIVAVILRFAMMPTYLQAYLNLAFQRIEEQKKEAGRITNVDLQKKIASIFYYLCVVTLQYVAPIILCLYLTLMYKTLGDYSWSDLFKNDHGASEVGECIDPDTSSATNPYDVTVDSEDNSILDTAQAFQMTLNSLKSVFTTEVYRGLLGFATWWCCFVWFAATSLGMMYQSYFTKS